jgi:hypothetical protein
MIVDDLFKRVDENDELFTHLKKQFPQLRQRTRAQRDADRDQQLADREARAQAHKDASKNAPPKEPTNTMSYDDSVVAFNDKMKAKGGRFTNMGDSVEPKHRMVDEAGIGTSIAKGVGTALDQQLGIKGADILDQPLPGETPEQTRIRLQKAAQQQADKVPNTAPTTALPATAPAGETPEQKRIRLQKAAAQRINNPAAPAVVPTANGIAPAASKVGVPAGKQAVDQAVATVKSVRSDRRPQVINYGKQQFDTLAKTPVVTPAAAVAQQPVPQYTTNLPATATATPNKPLSRAQKDYINAIGAPALPESRIAQTLKKSVTEMLAIVETKQDLQRIKQFVDQTFARHSTVTESSFAERNQLIKLIKEHSHTMAH